MKYPLHSKLLRAAGATAVFLFSVLALGWSETALAAESGTTQHLTSPDAVPEGLGAADWTSIRATYEAHRHEALRTDSGYRAHNPEQQWRTEFDGRGFITRPDAADWQWGLELKSYGFAGRKHVIDKKSAATAEGERVTYARDANLREWFVNDTRGLEHGFTVERRLARANDAKNQLEFDVAVRGTLHPEISADGASIRFVDAEGGAVVSYTGLKVTDARGGQLPARFAARGNGLRLLVDEESAHYPITVDPIAQQAYLKASNTDAHDGFGGSVAVSGDTVVVGATGESSNATGVNGDQTNNGAFNAGAAYVFVRNGTTWSQQAYLKASNTELTDRFGYSVAISGDTVVVGALDEDSDANEINGDQSDNSAQAAGAAYVFVRNGTTWTQQAYLKASDSEQFDDFGISVAVSGDTVLIGAPGRSYGSKLAAGAAFVFVRNGTTWSQQAFLKSSDPQDRENFGVSVALSNDTAVIAGPFETFNGAVGGAFVFVRNGVAWSEQAHLQGSNTEPDDRFADAVSVSGDTVVIGAREEGSNATGVNGDQTDNSAPAAGAAYVFARNGTTWSQEAYLKASNTDANDGFGSSVAISNDTVVVGAIGEASNATGVNGDQANNSAIGAGAAYVFTRNGMTWSQQAYLKASNPEIFDGFGFSVAFSGDTLVVAAGAEDSNATGVNGDQTDNSAVGAGAAYVFNGIGTGPTPTPTPAPTPPTQLRNVSTRLDVGVGENVLIGGFIITGNDPKLVVLRALGPSLGLSGVLADPELELHDASGILATNDDWMDNSAADQMVLTDNNLDPDNDSESALVMTLDPGAYTAILRGVNTTTGIALFEAYGLDTGGDSQLANISTRGLVMTGDNCLIAGFIVGADGDPDASVVIRALGPSLGDFDIAGPLLDPILELHNGDGDLIDSNDDWMDGPDAQTIEDDGLAPTEDSESALLMTAAPGEYTAIVRGVDDTTGVALVEVYNLGTND